MQEKQADRKKFRLSAAQDMQIEALLQKMTIREKVGQLQQLSPSIVGGFDVPFEELIEMMTDGRITMDEFQRLLGSSERDYHEDAIRAGEVSSCFVDDPDKANELQKIAVEESRLGIPLIFANDVIHGFRTVFPIPLAEACTWDEELFRETAEIAAREARANSVHWTFAPMVDISRDARWGRISESPGEDPYLASRYARAKVEGFQGTDLRSQEHVAACLKHFVGYGAAEGGQDYNTVSLSDSTLCNTYLPPFREGVEAGAATVMAAFHDLNGIPCTINSYLLRRILKEGYGFEGTVVSDATAVKECIAHGAAEDLADASKKAMEAGIDMDMNSNAYAGHLDRQAEEGTVPVGLLDDAVRRVLRIKMALGLFEHPYADESLTKRYEVLPQEHLDKAREAARKSIVLLKNEGILPLSRDVRIGLAGELAGEKTEVMGAWAISGRESDCVSVYEGLKNAGANVTYKKCCGVETPFLPEELEELAGQSDVIVAVVGELAAMSGEAASRANLELPGEQRELLKAALATGKPVVTVLMNGRPLALQWEKENLPALVEAWQLGVQMGNAVADVLFGSYNPGGKLSCTFPAVSGQCPKYYNHFPTGRPGSKSKFTSKYLDAPVEPLFPFGFGLSYTEFSYEGLKVRQEGETVYVNAWVSNTGSTAGEETAQLYVQDKTASLVRPVKELKGYQKIRLEPGDKKEIVFCLGWKELGFYKNFGEFVFEEGWFVFYMGGNSRDCLSEELYVECM